MEITLAIPNYNGASNLGILLEQVTKEEFAHIYVLDDVSSDNSEEVVKEFANVTFVKGKTNKGPGGNRNRVLEQEYADIIMFLDADMQLLVNNLKEKVLDSFADNNVALVGGQIMTLKDEPMWWNYGREMHPVRDAKADIVHEWALDNWENREKIEDLQNKFSDITPNLHISFGEPSVKAVDWVSEANFCVRSAVFKEISGFDAKMRYHADQDLCKRIRNNGHVIMHSPSIKTKHFEIDTFGETREEINREFAAYYYKKHWDMPQDIFDKLFPAT